MVKKQSHPLFSIFMAELKITAAVPGQGRYS
jgi:hypothetical protein